MKYFRTTTLLLLMIVLVLSSVSAIEYTNETIKQSVIDFEWRFNPEIQKDMYSANFNPYIDVVSGCEDVTMQLYAVLPTKLTTTEYYDETTCLWKDDKTQPQDPINDSYPQIEECTTTTKSKSINEDYEEWFDISQTDIFMTKEMYFVVKGKRKASTNYQSCDMNFAYDSGDGSLVFDVKDDFKLWWNATFNRKYKLEVNNATRNNNRSFGVVLNATTFTFDDCQSDGGDVRILNGTETGEVTYDLLVWNKTQEYGKIIINESTVTNKTYYLYCNSSTPLTTTSETIITSRMNTSQTAYYSFENNDFNDLTNNNYDGNNTGTTNTSGIVGDARDFNGTGQYIEILGSGGFLNGVGSEGTVMAWVNPDLLGAEYWIAGVWGHGNNEFIFKTDASSKFGMCFNGCSDTVSSTSALTGTGRWYHLSITWGGAGTFMYVDAVLNNTMAGFKTTVGATNLDIGRNDDGDQSYWNGKIDEFSIHSRRLGSDELLLIKEYSLVYPYYAEPIITIGASTGNLLQTNILTGIYNTQYNNVTLLINESQEFRVWANYTYVSNDSLVYPNANCEWNASEILQQDLFQNISTNVTVCSSGCDFVNRTHEVTGLETDNYIKDFLVFDVCRDDTATTKDINIATSCGFSTTFSFGSISLCSNGFTVLRVNTSDCGGAVTNVNLSVWTTGTPNANELVLVDSKIGIDREHNHTGNLTWNDTLQVFHGDLRTYFSHGSKNNTISCSSNISTVQNQTTSFSVSVENVPPTLSLDSLWDWFTGLVTIGDITVAMKYPLISSINASGNANDDDLDSCATNLSYTSNNTVIHSTLVFTNTTQLFNGINYTQSNFSVEDNYLDGVLSYDIDVFCNDTMGNFSVDDLSFTAENARPVINFTATSPLLIGVMPFNITWTATDAELETPTCYIFQNGTLNESGSGLLSHTANVPVGSYNYTLRCQDSLRNSTDQTLILSFVEGCVPAISGLEAYKRYRSTNQTIAASCTNNVTLSNCFVSVNKYAEESFNCTSASLRLDIGTNDLAFRLVSGGINSTAFLKVYAKEPGSGFSAYIVLIILTIVAFLLIAYQTMNGIPIYGILGGVIVIIIAFYVFTFSILAAIAVGIVGFFIIVKSLV